MSQTNQSLPLATVTTLPADVHADIACEDNLRYMRRHKDESMQLIVTSPPYNLGKEYEQRTTLERYIEAQAACIAEAVRLLHPTGSICWQAIAATFPTLQAIGARGQNAAQEQEGDIPRADTCSFTHK